MTRHLSLTLALMGLWACQEPVAPGEPPDTTGMTPDDGAIDAGPVEPAPCALEVSPEVVNFGIVSPPQPKNVGLALTNTGGQTCVAWDLSFEPAEYFRVTSGETQWEVAPGARSSLAFQALPGGPTGPAFISFQVNDPLRPRRVVTVDEPAGGPCLFASPSVLHFGTVSTGGPGATREVTLQLKCDTPAAVSRAQVAEPGAGACASTDTCPDFTAVGLPELGALLAPGQEVKALVRFKPTRPGRFQGELVVDVLLPTEAAQVNVILLGDGQ